jgi:hypothetical protein
VKLGTMGTYEIMKSSFGEETLNITRTFEWFSGFKNGRISITIDLSPGHSLLHSEGTIIHVCNKIQAGSQSGVYLDILNYLRN